MFRKMDKFGLAMIEQPFSPMDVVDHAKLQKMINTPICLDESITDPFNACQAIKLGACGFINIKPARVGGLGNSIKINKNVPAGRHWLLGWRHDGKRYRQEHLRRACPVRQYDISA